MTETELIAEVQSYFEEENSMGELDKITIVNAMVEGFKNINGIAVQKVTNIVEVNNYKADLPKGLHRLVSASEIEVLGYIEDEECDPVKHSKKFGLFEAICRGCSKYSHLHNDPKVKTHKKTYRWGDVELVYKSLKDLSIGQYTTDNRTKQGRSDVVIVNSYMGAPIRQGFMLVTYLAYPNTGKELYIPDTPRGDLKNYILNKALAEVSKRMMIRNRDSFMAELYNQFRVQEEYYYNRADYESKLKGIYTKEFKKKNRVLRTLNNRNLNI